MRIAVTGSNGFVGASLAETLLKRGYFIRVIVRKSSRQPETRLAGDCVSVGNIDATTEWEAALKGMDIIVHLAARVHVMNESHRDSLNLYRKVNLDGTVRLALQAAGSGIKRFIYISTIKVNGEQTDGTAFNADDIPAPSDPYSISKYEAEQKLREISAASGMEVVVIRPPVIYGPGVGANILRLMRLVESGIPLPLKSVQNARSMVSLGNITDLIIQCLEQDAAAGNTFLVSDGDDMLPPLLIENIALHMNVKPRLFAFPVALLRFAGKVSGRERVVNRLCNSLRVDIKKTREILGWSPPQSTYDAIKQMVIWYLGSNQINWPPTDCG